MNNRTLDSFHLKMIALLTMAIDHTGVIILLPIFGSNSLIYVLSRLIGRIAFPLFTFMIVEGVFYSRHKEKYLLRLTSMAVIIGFAITALLALNVPVFAGNIFVDLTLGALAVYLLSSKHFGLRLLAIFPFLYIAILEHFSQDLSSNFFFFNAIRSDYGIYGFTLIMSFFLAKQYTFRQRKLAPNLDLLQQTQPSLSRPIQASYYSGLALLFINLLWYGAFLLQPNNLDLQLIGIQSYAILTIFLIFVYSGKKGYSSRWFQAFTYAFYPLHFVVLYLIYTVLTTLL